MAAIEARVVVTVGLLLPVILSKDFSILHLTRKSNELNKEQLSSNWQLPKSHWSKAKF